MIHNLWYIRNICECYNYNGGLVCSYKMSSVRNGGIVVKYVVQKRKRETTTHHLLGWKVGMQKVMLMFMFVRDVKLLVKHLNSFVLRIGNSFKIGQIQNAYNSLNL